MPKTFDIRAGERTRVLWLYSSSIPGQVRFRASAANGGALTGKVELRKRRWFEWEVTEHDLHPRNVFDKGFSDSDYRIFVTPDQDCRIEFETRHFRAEYFFRILAGVLILGIISALSAFIFAPPGNPSGQ